MFFICKIEKVFGDLHAKKKKPKPKQNKKATMTKEKNKTTKNTKNNIPLLLRRN